MAIHQHTIKESLEALGFTLTDTPKPGGSYVSVNVRGTTAYVAIQFPIQGDAFLYLGRLGKDLSTAEGYQAASLAAANVIAQVEKYVGFEHVLGLNHADIYFQAQPGWDDGPRVADGASELFVKVLKEKGTHSRAIFGVDRLPRNFCVGITCSFTLIK